MEKKANLFIVTAAALWGCIGIFLKLLTAAGLTSMQSVAVRCATAALLYFFWLLFKDPAALKIRLHDCKYFVGTGLCSLLFFNWCYFRTIQTSSLSVAAVLLYTSPVFVMLMSAIFFREPVTHRKLISLLLTFLGCMLVTGVLPLGSTSISGKTVLFGLGSGFGYALYTIFGKFALAKYPSGAVTFYTFLFAALGAVPLSGLLHTPQLLLDWRVLVGGLSIGIFCCILPYLLYTEGLIHAQAGKAAILATLEPFVASFIGIVCFREAITLFKLLGMAAIFAAILLLNKKDT